ncbi:1,3-beta-galactosyl-N-acetylhexosamine phosphorylase N-terminal domain-containing protein [Cutibacterium sp. V947]|uniref:1,3-beta-galactosyl-N-acetylhexosamine phosphorylase N-terminal domain-containing protein n=1 Tax=unclassified Cutibacterium TaxID=2649671 RepID=UPI003EDF8702
MFDDEGDPVGKANTLWVQTRRAILGNPLNRIGDGGHLLPASQYPELVERISRICQELRDSRERSDGRLSRTAAFGVGLLNCWCARRA